MEIKLKQETLLKAINSTMRGIPLKSTMPILECVLLNVQNDEVHLIGNNTELGVEVFLREDDAEIIENGMVCLDAKTFLAIVSKLPNGDVTLKTEGEGVIIKCGRSKFNIAGKDGSEYPIMDITARDNEIKLSQETLKDVIRQTVFATAQNENNKLMTGELFSINGDKLKVIALDGHRIAIREITLDGMYEPVEVVIPAKTLQEISKLLSDGDISMFIADTQVAFSFDDVLVTSRTIDGTFFDVAKMMQSDFTTTIKVDRQEFMACVDRATLLIREIDRKPVIFTIGEALKAEITTQLGSMSEDIEIEATGSPLAIGLNPKFLNDVLRVLDENTVTMYFNDGAKPCYINGEGYSYLILPIRY